MSTIDARYSNAKTRYQYVAELTDLFSVTESSPEWAFGPVPEWTSDRLGVRQLRMPLVHRMQVALTLQSRLNP